MKKLYMKFLTPFFLLLMAGCSTLGLESECDINAQQLQELAIPPELKLPSA